MNLSKRSVDVKTLDPKVENRLAEVKKVLQQVDVLKKQVNDQVGDLLKQISDLEKRVGMFNAELIPLLKELHDHAISAEGIYVELKRGRRSPKSGYDYLAERVNSQLLAAAQEAMEKASEFAQSPSFSLRAASISKRAENMKLAGLLDWVSKKWHDLVKWLAILKTKVSEIGSDVKKLEMMTRT